MNEAIHEETDAKPLAAEDQDMIRSVAKALSLLEKLGDVGVASIGHLSTELAMPKASVVRILQTLMQLGYVHQSAPRADYRITSRLSQLGARFEGLPALLEATADLTEELTARVLWPVSVGQRVGDEIIVRYSTMPHSPYAHTRSTVGKRLPLLTSAHGRAWLAHVPLHERPSEVGATSAEGSLATLASTLQHVVSRGFAMRAFGRDPTTNTIAVPLFLRGRVVATIGLTFFARVLDAQKIAALALDLQNLSAEAERKLGSLTYGQRKEAAPMAVATATKS